MTEKQILERLVEIRKEKKITQKRMAAEIGIDTGYLSMIERGKAMLNLRRFMRMCEVLQVTPYYVLESANKNPEREEILMKIIKGLLPEDMELLVGIAQMLHDRHDLRP